MKTIKFYGILAEKFGANFMLDVATAQEATYALSCQMPDFKKFMLDSEENGLQFAVFSDDKNIGVNDIDSVTDANIIHVVPRIVGSGLFDWLQVIGGAILIGTGLAGFGFLGATAAMSIGAGAGLMLGGVASLLMPTPDLGSQDPDENRANHGFGGAVTTVSQGNIVPVLYGRREIGGFYASAGIFSEDIK